jgi:hypothetical protein
MSNFQFKNLRLQVYKKELSAITFLAGFAAQGIINEEPTFWVG